MIKYEERGYTEQDILQMPKVNNRSFYVGEKDIYLKLNKNDIINLGSKELLRDINNVFSFDTGTNLILFLALCGNERVTDFKGDPYKKVEELAEGVSNLSWNYKDYLEKTRKERQVYPIYSNRSVKSILAKNYVEKEIERIEDLEVKDSWDKNKLENYKGKVNTLDDEMLKVIELGKHYLIRVQTQPLAEDVDFYYGEMVRTIELSARYMRPQKDNDTPYRLKLKHLRDRDSLCRQWKLKKSSFNNKTGDLWAIITDNLSEREISLNIYKDDISQIEYKNNINLTLLLGIIMKEYENSNLTKKLKSNIISVILENYGADMWSYRKTNGIYSDFKMGDRYYNTFVCDEDKYDIKNNHLKILSNIVANLDKINNLPEYDLYNENRNWFEIPKKRKWKVHELWGLNKQAYRKLLELNSYERHNFVVFTKLIKKYFRHLDTEIEINKLFDDTFLMVQDTINIYRALNHIEINDYLQFSFSEFKKAVYYLDVDVPNRQRITGYPMAMYYGDYLNYSYKLIQSGYRTRESFNVTPFSLKLEHDIVSDEYQSIEDELNDKELKERYSDKLEKIFSKTYKLDNENIKFLKADTVDKLKDEGKSLSHCVGGYANRIIKDECLILLARKEEELDKSWFTVEVRITDNGYVLGQQQSINEYKLPNKLREQLEKDIKDINREIQNVA